MLPLNSILFGRRISVCGFSFVLCAVGTEWLVYKPNIKVLDIGEAKSAQTHAKPSNGADAGGEDGGLSTRHAAADGALCWQKLGSLEDWIRAHSGGSWASNKLLVWGPYTLLHLRRASWTMALLHVAMAAWVLLLRAGRPVGLWRRARFEDREGRARVSGFLINIGRFLHAACFLLALVFSAQWMN